MKKDARRIWLEEELMALHERAEHYLELRAEEGAGQMARGGQVVNLPYGTELEMAKQAIAKLQAKLDEYYPEPKAENELPF